MELGDPPAPSKFGGCPDRQLPPVPRSVFFMHPGHIFPLSCCKARVFSEVLGILSLLARLLPRLSTAKQVVHRIFPLSLSMINGSPDGITSMTR